MNYLKLYKKKYHFSINFYAIFLLVTFIPDFYGVNQALVNYSLWGLKTVLACWIIFSYRRKVYSLRPGERLFLVTALIYFVNIFIDLFLQKYPVGMGNPIDLFNFFVTILIAFSFRYDKSFSSVESFNLFVVLLTLGLCISLKWAQESAFPYEGRYYANSTVNTIVYGQMGCALAISGVFGFFNKKTTLLKIVFVLLFFLGILTIMKAGSRSPIVVLFAVCGFYALARLGFIKGMVLVLFTTVIIWLSLASIIKLAETFNSGIIARVERAVEKGETSGRDKIYANTLNIIKEKPVLGSYYLVPSGEGRGEYPHNFFLEVFMTTGLLGGIPFVLMIIIAVNRSFLLIKNDHKSTWVVLLFIQMLVYGMFSSSLFSSQDFWALCLFLLSMKPDLGRNTD